MSWSRKPACYEYGPDVSTRLIIKNLAALRRHHDAKIDTMQN